MATKRLNVTSEESAYVLVTGLYYTGVLEEQKKQQKVERARQS